MGDVSCICAKESELRGALLELALPAGQRSRASGTPSQDESLWSRNLQTSNMSEPFFQTKLRLQGGAQCCWNSIVEAGQCHHTFCGTVISCPEGGNNTVAVAPGFMEVRAVEINKKLAEAAEDRSDIP